jgi:hypothetical protein
VNISLRPRAQKVDQTVEDSKFSHTERSQYEQVRIQDRTPYVLDIKRNCPLRRFALILQRVESLLCDDREIGKYTRPVSRQRLGKHVSTATN